MSKIGGKRYQRTTQTDMVHRISNTDRIEVIDVTTGQFWLSIKHCALQNGIPPRTLNRWLRENPQDNKTNFRIRGDRFLIKEKMDVIPPLPQKGDSTC